RARSKTEKKFRIGLRQGENEIVVKIVIAAGAPGGRPGPVFVGGMPNQGQGGAFTFNLTPEGDDVVTHEVATALRLEAQERAKSAALALVAGAGAVVKPSAAPVVAPRQAHLAKR